MTSPQESQKKRSWIYRNLSGYMIAVFVIDLALGGLWLSISNYPEPVSHFSLILLDSAIIVNAIPPIVIVARWIATKCAGVFWPVKFASMVAVAGAFMLIGGIMAEYYVNVAIAIPSTSSYTWSRVMPSTNAVTINSTPSEIRRAFHQIQSAFFDAWDDATKEQIEDDPVGYLKGHPWLYDAYPNLFAEALTREQYADYEQKVASIHETIKTITPIHDSAMSASRTVGAFGFVLLVGGGIGAGGMAYGIKQREKRK